MASEADGSGSGSGAGTSSFAGAYHAYRYLSLWASGSISGGGGSGNSNGTGDGIGWGTYWSTTSASAPGGGHAAGPLLATMPEMTSANVATAAITIALLSLLGYVHRVRSSYPELPKAWRAAPSSPTGLYDSSPRLWAKTTLTTLLLSVLPLQVVVVATSIVLQTVLYYAGFGGGRPGTPAFPAVPVSSPAWNPLARLFFRLRDCAANFAAPYLLNDVRNAPFLPWMAYLALVTPTLFFLAAYHHVTVGRYQPLPYQLLTCFIYRILMMGPYFKFFAHGATLIHKEGHANRTRRGLFRAPYSALGFNHVMERWVGFFYGHVPENYSVGHVEVHHGEGNDHGDVTSTLGVDRSRDKSFLMYLADFCLFWSNWDVVGWCDVRIDREEKKLKQNQQKEGATTSSSSSQLLSKLRSDRRSALLGMLTYYGAAVVLTLTVGPFFSFFYYVEPHLEVINYLAAINYTWHAFADPTDHNNEYVKSITILDGHYLVFGEDYHVEHHLRPGVHWTQMANEFERRKDAYAHNRATVFADTMEFELFVMILMGDVDALASKFVDLSGKFPTREDKRVELLRRMGAVPK